MSVDGKVTVTLLITSVLSIIVAGIFFMLDRSSKLSYGLYTNLTTDIQFEYQTPITPIAWVNNHWNAVFIWLAFFIIYGLSTTFRRIHYTQDFANDYGDRACYLYKQPNGGVIPPMAYLSIIIISLISVAYLFLWDMLLFRACAALVVISSLISHISYSLIARHTFYCQSLLFDCSKAADVWLIRILGLNGLALLTSWLTFLGLLSFSVAVVYNDGGSPTGVSHEVVGKIFGGLYLGWILISFLSDLFFLEKYTRYVIVQYISAMLCGCGIVLFRPSVYGDFPLSTQLGFAILGLAGCAFIIKLIFAVFRHFTNPLRFTGKDSKDGVDFLF